MHFEALKAGLSQNRDGLVLRLVVHPNDLPQDVLTAPVGARWMVAISFIPETEEQAEVADGARVMQLAAVLCKSEQFWAFLRRNYANKLGLPQNYPTCEANCADMVRRILDLDSRRELMHNKEAGDRLRALNEEFLLWQG